MIIKPNSGRRILMYKQKYLGLAELAKILDMSIQATYNWKARGHLPKPYIELSMGPIWTQGQIKKWIENN